MDYGLGGYRTIDAFVAAKLDAFSKMPRTFESLFALMFREEKNVMYEQSEGYRIRKTTYGEAKRAALSMAAALAETLSSVPEGSVVGLYLDNSLLWIESLWAILAAGYRPLLMNMRLPDDALTDAIRSVGCAAVLTRSRSFGLPAADPASLAADGEPIRDRAFGGELLVMSSGTTAHVKVCAYTAEEFYYQIFDSFDIIRRCAQVKKHCDGSLKLLAFLPFYHVFGLIAVYIWFAFFSRTFVHLGDMAPETIVNTVKRHRVTHIFAVPLFWEKVEETARKTIARRGEKTAEKFDRAMRIYRRLPDGAARVFSRIAMREVRSNLFGDSIRFMISGGSAIPPSTLEFFNGIGYRLANGYGMTEIGITSFETSPKKKYLLGGFVGSPMSHVEYSIGEGGELHVRGDVIAEYVVEGGVRRDRGGWFPTRDLAECVDGHFRILGRRDDLIVAADGENLNPTAIEPLVTPKSSGGVCLTAEDTPEGKIPVLLVSVGRFAARETVAGTVAEAKELIAAAGLAGRIRRVVPVGEPLIKGDEFKLNRLRLARQLAEGTLPVRDPDAPEAEGETDALVAAVADCFAAALGIDAVSPDADFFLDCGGTSLDYFAMISKLREDFGVPFPSEGGRGLNTPRGIADFIRNERGG